MKKIIPIAIKIWKNWYHYWSKFLRILGDIKVFKYPMWLQYSPDEYDYKIHGEQLRTLISKLEPGDVVLRKYTCYLDNYIIPGEFSHSGIYIGDNKIIHAIAEGVQEIDVLDFFQCDNAAILRPDKGQEDAIETAKKLLGREYDFKFNTNDDSALYCHELTARCFKNNIEIDPVYAAIGGKEFKFLGEKYIADCFLSNPHFKLIHKAF